MQEMTPDRLDREADDTERLLATKLWRLAEVIAAARRIHSSLSLDEVLNVFLEVAVEEVGGTDGALYLVEGRKSLRLMARRTLELRDDSWEHYERVAAKTLECDGVEVEPGVDGREKIVSLPLRDEAKSAVGILQIRLQEGTGLDEGARHLLSELSHFAALSIRNAQFHEDSLEKAELDREIAVAREIQMGTLPSTMPDLFGYDIAGTSRPASETGGDSFDAFQFVPNSVALLLADATGHGLGPALSVTQVRSMLRMAIRLGADLDEVHRHINDQLCEDLQANRFVTAFIGMLDGAAHTLRFHSAGQGPLLHFQRKPNATVRLSASCVPLGILPTTKPEAPRVVRMEVGDVFGLITDGVFEATNADGEEFGEDRVEEILRDSAGESCVETIGRLMESVDAFRGDRPQEDDITIVFVRRTL